MKGQQYSVFLVEDDKFFLEILESYFGSKNNFQTKRFLTAEECESQLHLQPDLVILDYFLDKHNEKALDGKYLYKKITEKCPSAKIIMVSAQQSAHVVFGLVKEGVRNYIMKDKNTFEELDALLEEYAWI